jgi:hypothetical protein
MSSSSEKIYADLDELLSQMKQLAENNPVEHDRHIGVSRDKEIVGNTIKFFVHGKMLGNSDALIPDDAINAAVLTKLSGQLRQDIEKCRAVNETLCDKLTDQLSDPEAVIENLSRRSPRLGR